MNRSSYGFYCLMVLFPTLFLGTTGCSHVYYNPNYINVPLFREKNVFKGSGAVGFGEASTSYDLQAAYSDGKHLGIIADYMHSRNGGAESGFKTDPGNQNKARDNNFEIGAGYFTPLSRDILFEVYGGLGTGSQRHDYYDFNLSGTSNYDFAGYSEIGYFKTFLQPSLGVSYRFLDAAITMRLTGTSFGKVSNYVESNSIYYSDLNILDRSKQFWFFEPGFTLRAGSKNFKVQIQYIRSVSLSDSETYLLFEYSKIAFGFFFSFDSKSQQTSANDNR